MSLEIEEVRGADKSLSVLMICTHIYGALVKQNNINMASIATFIEVSKAIKPLGNSETIVRLEKLLKESKSQINELDEIEDTIEKLLEVWKDEVADEDRADDQPRVGPSDEAKIGPNK